jgi:hypothetical protein
MKIIGFCLFAIQMIAAALPPGFEDELYCPPGMCLLRADHPQGWGGPKTSYYVCSNPLTCELTKIHPRGWGNKLDSSFKDEILHDGWVIAPHCPIPCDATTKGLFISLIPK